MICETESTEYGSTSSLRSASVRLAFQQMSLPSDSMRQSLVAVPLMHTSVAYPCTRLPASQSTKLAGCSVYAYVQPFGSMLLTAFTSSLASFTPWCSEGEKEAKNMVNQSSK